MRITNSIRSSYSFTTMNHLHQLYRANIKVLILLGLVVIVGLSGCKENGEVVPVVTTTQLDVINADVNPLNIYQNGSRLNQISSLSPNSESGYLVAPTGTNMYEFKIAGQSDYILTNYPITLDTGLNHYSLFVAGETPDKIFLIKDLIPALSATQATLRIVNASPGSTGLTVYVGSSYNVTGSSFKSASVFSNVNAGANVISVYTAGASTPLYTKTVTLLASSTYTLFISGQVNGTGNNALAATIVLNQ
jgi:hypothetical protein